MLTTASRFLRRDWPFCEATTCLAAPGYDRRDKESPSVSAPSPIRTLRSGSSATGHELPFAMTYGPSVKRRQYSVRCHSLRDCATESSESKACIGSGLSLVEPIQTLDDGARIGPNRARRLSSCFEPSTSRQHAHQRMADQRYALDLRVVDHAAARSISSCCFVACSER